MIVVKVINQTGEEGTLRLRQIVSIDGKAWPFEESAPSLVELSHRVTLIETVIATVLGDIPSPPQPLQASCSVES